jgi:hypothetical protein
MVISKDYVPFMVVGVAAAALMGYFAYLQLNVEDQTYPDVEIAVGGGFNHPILPNVNTEYSTPENSLCQVVTLPHRYPQVSGGNITALIHHGWSPLRMSKGMDSRWITRPPAEVMW